MFSYFSFVCIQRAFDLGRGFYLHMRDPLVSESVGEQAVKNLLFVTVYLSHWEKNNAAAAAAATAATAASTPSNKRKIAKASTPLPAPAAVEKSSKKHKKRKQEKEQAQDETEEPAVAAVDEAHDQTAAPKKERTADEMVAWLFEHVSFVGRKGSPVQVPIYANQNG